MPDVNLTAFLLSALARYGALALGLALLLGPLGLPIPTGILLLAAGASVRQGLLPAGTALVVALGATVLGDSLSYVLGRHAGGWVERLFRRRRDAWHAAQARFRRYGARAVVATRVLLTALDVPTNLIAGSSRYAFGRFLASDLAGRTAWLALYGGLGYALGSQWPLGSRLIHTYSGWLALAILPTAGVWLALSFHRRPQHRLRFPRDRLAVTKDRHIHR